VDKKTRKWIGIGVLLSGLILLLAQFMPAQQSFSVSTTKGKLGMRLTVQKEEFPLFAIVQPGQEYKFKVTVENTGDVDWPGNYHWTTIRIGIAGAGTKVVDCPSSPTCPDYEGKALVETCGDLVDHPECREDPHAWFISLVSGPEGTPDTEDKIHSYTVKETLKAGDSYTLTWKIRIPDNAQRGDYPLIINGAVSSPWKKIWGYTKETITIGEISGKIALEWLGIVMSLVGLALVLLP